MVKIFNADQNKICRFSPIDEVLFSLPKLLDEDFLSAVKLLQQMGYTELELELFGPYTFSEQSAKDRWQAITPALGFSGSG